jgi:hypothetical protein
MPPVAPLFGGILEVLEGAGVFVQPRCRVGTDEAPSLESDIDQGHSILTPLDEKQNAAMCIGVVSAADPELNQSSRQTEPRDRGWSRTTSS